jgi:hypothetical protein
VADYAAIFLPGQRITMQASGTIAGGDLVVVSGSRLPHSSVLLRTTPHPGRK